MMPTETNLKSPIADDLSNMIVALTLQCAHCGYDLRGLSADGDCPECGEPIRLTIIETIDPASRRLTPILNPRIVGNSISGVVTAFFFSILLAVTALLINSPAALPVPFELRTFPTSSFVWGAVGTGLLALLSLCPMMRMCQRKELVGCRAGILLTLSGLVIWCLSLLSENIFSNLSKSEYSTFAMLINYVFPVISVGLVFTGFRKLIPRLGQRSRAFRQAQGSRQRMNDLLVTLVVFIVGQTLLAISSVDTNLAFLGLVLVVVSASFILIGLAYVMRNTFWIRNALVMPPPALDELLRST
ncbi:hypothetical protein H8D99_00780 [bacterium]|nr:hypothetical protein [bacterium]